VSKDLSAAVKRSMAELEKKLRPGERMVQACTDLCGCSCVHHEWNYMPCTVVARNKATRRDRCLLCGATWRKRDGGWQPLVLITQGATC
jgi:hypothetical protein